MAGSIHLFKITGTLVPEKVKLKQNLVWDILELDWKGVSVTLNGNKINLPKSIMIKFLYSSVGRAVDCHATGLRFNTHSTWLGVDSAFHPSVGR